MRPGRTDLCQVSLLHLSSINTHGKASSILLSGGPDESLLHLEVAERDVFFTAKGADNSRDGAPRVGACVSKLSSPGPT